MLSESRYVPASAEVNNCTTKNDLTRGNMLALNDSKGVPKGEFVAHSQRSGRSINTAGRS